MSNSDRDDSQDGNSHREDSRYKVPERLNDFAELDLPSPILKAIDDLAYVNCTPIQSKVLPYALDGYDIIGQAQTGTGKTAAFLITLLTYHLENPEIGVFLSNTENQQVTQLRGVKWN